MAWDVPAFSLGGQPRIGTNWADGILGARADKQDRQQKQGVMDARGQAVAQATKPDGSIDWGRASQFLLQGGDIQGAQIAGSRADQEADNSYRRERAGVQDSQWAAGHALDQQRVAQAGTKRETNTPESRAALAEQNGLQPGTPEFQRYVLTGSLPASDRGVTAGDREAIRDSDDLVQSGQNTITLLDKALGLSGQAYSGVGAKTGASIEANLPDWMVPDAISGGSKAQAEATLELDNVVMDSALGQMKQIFGGNPTEGERAVLLDIQGSANKPLNVRQAILNRARGLVERRIAYNRDKAEELRGGSYYKPNSGQQPPAQAQPAAATPAAPRLRWNPQTGDFE